MLFSTEDNIIHRCSSTIPLTAVLSLETPVDRPRRRRHHQLPSLPLTISPHHCQPPTTTALRRDAVAPLSVKTPPSRCVAKS